MVDGAGVLALCSLLWYTHCLLPRWSMTLGSLSVAGGLSMLGVSVYHSAESERGGARWPCGTAGGVLCYKACALAPARHYTRDRSSGAEQGPFKPRVVGSNPTGLTHFSPRFFLPLHVVLVAPPHRIRLNAIASRISPLKGEGSQRMLPPQRRRLPGIAGKIRLRAAGVAL